MGNRAAGQLLTSAFLISVVLMAGTLLWKRQLLRFLFRKVETDVMDACVIYLRITALFFPALAICNAGAALCRSTGRTDLTMKISVAANIINVVGNAIGIFILRAGVAGVAYPTVIARVFSALVITAVCFRPAQSASYRWENILVWDQAMLRRILKIAVPSGIENGLFQVVKVALGSVTALFGTVQIAANGIAQSFWTLAAAPLVMMAYPLSDEITHLVVVLVLIHNTANSFAYPASGALPNGLRAAGDVRFTMAVASTIVIRFVLSIVFGIWMNLGVTGIALAICCDWIVRAVLFVHRFRSGKWKTFQVIG